MTVRRWLDTAGRRASFDRSLRAGAQNAFSHMGLNLRTNFRGSPERGFQRSAVGTADPDSMLMSDRSH
jgi:hypothetical protein